jgi:hypothetical protein
VDTRLRVGRAIGKNEGEVALAMMSQIKERGNPERPPAIASDGNDSYPEGCLRLGERCQSTLVEDDLRLENCHIRIGSASR